MLARLGLRAGEVAGLSLQDIDWRAGELVVRGKGGRCERLPLPADVVEAIVGYLRARMPESAEAALPQVPAEPLPGAATEPATAPAIAEPLPAYAAAPGAGCQETGMRVVIGCGGCAGSVP